MINLSEKYILFIEPKLPPSKEPLIDDITKKMTGLFRQSKIKDCFKGFHICNCGVNDDACTRILNSGETTNSLCLHYLAFHRKEVPRTELAKILISSLDIKEEIPDREKLCYPKR